MLLFNQPLFISQDIDSSCCNRDPERRDINNIEVYFSLMKLFGTNIPGLVWQFHSFRPRSLYFVYHSWTIGPIYTVQGDSLPW